MHERLVKIVLHVKALSPKWIPVCPPPLPLSFLQTHRGQSCSEEYEITERTLISHDPYSLQLRIDTPKTTYIPTVLGGVGQRLQPAKVTRYNA